MLLAGSKVPKRDRRCRPNGHPLGWNPAVGLCCFAWVAQRQYLSTLHAFTGSKVPKRDRLCRPNGHPLGLNPAGALPFRMGCPAPFIKDSSRHIKNVGTTVDCTSYSPTLTIQATLLFHPACLAVHHTAPASPSMATALTSSLQKASSKFLHSFMCIDPWTKLHFLRYIKYTCFISKCFHIFHINYNCCQAAPISPFDCLY